MSAVSYITAFCQLHVNMYLPNLNRLFNVIISQGKHTDRPHNKCIVTCSSQLFGQTGISWVYVILFTVLLKDGVQYL